uniref:Zinc finger protein n=1 Tax=Ciona intestinalis TaxID=7719 RepID=Q1RL44_CIOIN|nr:zinc finger protein ZF(C3H)-17 [Ciona intestinalis]FAA00221.1 TPA: zinc finger protein [Ciona intestinalis]|eukprot:NP_001123328.1 zinc finger protein ZF(C3H)-17 [Ciona intestinalis]
MASTPPQTEKPFHYTYLKEFRVNQCPLFLQHKCTQHRPFTCFNWHFSNQRRRRPIKRRDGLFNYSADVYCSKYDETTGICPNGDDCLYIHRNTGDTERRYHLRYYKTGTCIHETDSRGNCVKNGPHCAFAHGAQDLRPPVYDVREQSMEQNQMHSLSEQMNHDSVNLAEKIVNEDPKWQDANFVLANYKTELCKRPPRLCRQGYACPQYHNAKDRRRNPKKYKYRSSPCPNVKQGDDWKDPSCCEKGDSCLFCHTRTEQQFHPEIYKSTKCHDMTQTGYCPRGPFCAFAHVEQEIRIIEGSPTMVSDIVQNEVKEIQLAYGNELTLSDKNQNTPNLGWPFNPEVGDGNITLSNQLINNEHLMSKSFPSCPSPISKPRTASLSSNKDAMNYPYSKAPGSERSAGDNMNNTGFGASGPTVSWPGIGSGNQRSALVGSYSSTNSSPPHNFPRPFNVLNTEAAPFYPPDETVDSVVGNALEDLDIFGNKVQEPGGNNGSNLKMWTRQVASSNSVQSSLLQMSDPVNIPQDTMMRSNFPNGMRGSLSSVSPLPKLVPGMEFPSSDPLLAPQMSGRFPMGANSRYQMQGNQSMPSMSSSLGSGMVPAVEFERMQEKCKQWERSWNQAKAACDAWKREATDANERAKSAEEHGKQAQERVSALENHLKSFLEQKNENSQAPCKFLHQHYERNDLKPFNVANLKQLQVKYKEDLELIQKHIWELLCPPQT